MRNIYCSYEKWEKRLSEKRIADNTRVFGLDNFAVNAATNTMAEDAFGFGPLGYKPGDILSLPKGFTARVISQNGDKMADGLLSPGTHDGMGAFRGKNGNVILVRNHELSPYAANGPFGRDYSLVDKIEKEKIYDYGSGTRTCVGGTTTLVYNEEKGKVELEYLSLVGTVRNCAGGISPWNSWITCEETELKTGDEQGALEKDHGYNFEVKASDKILLSDPVPLKAMGRFVHEAVAFHPATGIVYQTEDSADGSFYRYIPMNMASCTRAANYRHSPSKNGNRPIPGTGRIPQNLFRKKVVRRRVDRPG